MARGECATQRSRAPKGMSVSHLRLQNFLGESVLSVAISFAMAVVVPLLFVLYLWRCSDGIRGASGR